MNEWTRLMEYMLFYGILKIFIEKYAYKQLDRIL